MATDSSKLSCRMYRAKYPELDDLVVVTVQKIADMGTYVRLKEYGDIEGMILLSELSRRRIRSIQKLIRVGRDEVAVVLRVDKEKGYIDLSKRRVLPEDVAKCEEKFSRSRTVHTIMRHVADRCNLPLIELQEQITWPLYDKYGHAHDAFKLAITDPDKVFEGLNIDPAVYKELISNIRRRMAPAPVKVRADVELTCFEYEGINAIRSAIRAGEALSSSNVAIKVRLVAPPLYVVNASTLEKDLGITRLQESISAMKSELAKFEGNLNIKMEPRVVSAIDDQELQERMVRAEKDNAEVSGDDDDEASDSEEDDENIES